MITRRIIQILFIMIIVILGGFIILEILEPEKKIDNWEEYWASKKDKISVETSEVEPEPIEIEERQIQYTKSMIKSDGIDSYWFVIVIPKNKNGTKYNSWIKQEHSYFSPTEAYKTFGDGEYFMYYFTEISEATYIDACMED